MALAPDFDKKLRRLHGRGMSANAIAKQLSCAQSTVSAHAKKLGLTFERTATAAAVEAHTVDLKARRKAILVRLYNRIDKNLDRLEAGHYSYRIVLGGSEFGPSSEVVEDVAPPSADERAHMATITGYLASAVKLEQVDADGGESAAKSMLLRLGELIGIETGE